MPRYANPVEAIGYAVMELFARRTLARDIELRVEGADRLPPVGATLIVARHYHALLDGVVLLRHARRPTHILVALDWARSPIERRGMELACRMARWPTVLRTDAFNLGRGHFGRKSAYRPDEAQPMLRAATRLATTLLREGQTLVVFPEAYPNVDTLPSPKDDGRAFLPFESGFTRLAQLAQRDGQTRVSIVPAGFVYEKLPSGRWRITLRYGEPRGIAARATADEVAALVAEMERDVQALSAQPIATPVAAAETSTRREMER
ncbi:MAG TPA: 1-acyl-sn-glycerol-3-phosphate acyltransferase [Ktedonobacterales bacterium]|nr:1-acyl-sn-glycerol-3-phosphate acyltransferase [Ktedonobacterales bacterium]